MKALQPKKLEFKEDSIAMYSKRIFKKDNKLIRNFVHAREIAKKTKKVYLRAQMNLELVTNEMMGTALNVDSDSDGSVKGEFPSMSLDSKGD